MTIRAMGPRILVRETQLQSREHAGIHLILREPDKLSSGKVLSIGKHAKVEALGLSEGDTVWFRRECGVQPGDDSQLVFLLAEQLEAVGEGNVMALNRRPDKS
ncbi:MAG: hypothetical protein IPO08_20535 [Xanthomonadales bacterium]|nr:hypothetical protein [Xanthomonadales bacterium]